MGALRELFPFGDLDDEVVGKAASRFATIDQDELGAGFAFGKAAIAAMEHLTSVLDESGLTPARWRLLMALVVQTGPDGATIGDLAGHLNVREPTITATVDRLEREGLVIRTRSDEDRRVVRVTLTKAGAKTVASLVPNVADRVSGFVGAMGGPEELRRIASRLESATLITT